MERTQLWKRFPCFIADQIILYKYYSSGSDYSILITDLSRIWRNQSNKADILREASHGECSIDPSQGASQLSILLQKIQDVLEGKPHTKATISSGSSDDLKLSLEAPLPQPLEPFQWTVRLARLPIADLQVHLINPLITTAWFRSQQIEDLIEQLHEKDHVISKLLDKMESSGTDLTTVFPGAAGIKISRRAASREAVAKHIKGLAPFDEQKWLERDVQSKHNLDSPKTLFRNAFEDRRSVISEEYAAAIPVLENKWWRKSPSVVSKAMTIKGGSAAEGSRSPTQTYEKGNENSPQADIPNASNGHSSSDQSTGKLVEAQDEPSNTSGNMPDVETDDDVTDDEEDGPDIAKKADRDDLSQTVVPQLHRDIPSETADIQPKECRPISKQLGTIGGKRKADLVSPKSETEQQNTASLESRDIDLDSDANNNIAVVRATEASVPRAEPPLKKLGMVGGRKGGAIASSSELTSTATPEAEKSPASKGKLGVIGSEYNSVVSENKTRNSPAKDLSAGTAVGSRRSDENAGNAAVEEQRGEQKVAKKREDLKRQLETKSKAPIKKRRF
ncbi:MAG: hypothetical protein M1820_007899 [Bogoriella megaspora]|nr:MAG: hypothetical protein M1820_007899 [Bogoriella megaspora]